jgi:signal transduction histidine kinase
VTDNGSGIDPELVAQAFQPFQSTKGQAGTGLGLAAAKKIVDEHGGNLVVEHHVPCGTSFHAQFPVKRLAGEPTLPPGP